LQEYDDTLLEPFDLDGLTVPLLRLTAGDVPAVDIKVGGLEFHYDRSYPLTGYGAVLPKYVMEQVAAGKKPLLVERPERYYVYWVVEQPAAVA
jgi:hypothetical protein